MENRSTQKATIYAVGDSLTWGYPYGPEYSWTTMVEAALKQPVINLGVNGATTDDMRREIINILPDVEPRSIVIVTGGANDAFEGVSQERFLRNYRDMVERIQIARCQPVIGLTLPINEEPFGERVILFRECLLDELKTESAWKDVLVVDFFRALAAPNGVSMDPLLAEGECHPNKAGYRKMGEAAIDFFASL
ncbi:hypothetical protein GJ688_17970 [Heliobacillus mobilis]|uniref:SGNH hydrolase-type esterase domain-containing protein n=1 Tax=Heliobacterium mobile TaxID=28064 RepID=A0A6I3SQZ5_HELMO|nr:GDSL-type esterase/lipase family protein [Heliobacterium mobile]MTV50822.1 hypothetical protein [Heliobacterium mobile]